MRLKILAVFASFLQSFWWYAAPYWHTTGPEFPYDLSKVTTMDGTVDRVPMAESSRLRYV